MRLIRIIVGTGIDRDGVEIGSSSIQLTRLATRTAAIALGGVTVGHSQGAWIAPNGDLVMESSLIFESYTDKPISTIFGLAQNIGGLFNQHSVVVDDSKRADFHLEPIGVHTVFYSNEQESESLAVA